jgi:hypothetical protein
MKKEPKRYKRYLETRRQKRDYSLEELEKLKTLYVGQCDDLKIDEGDTRVWLSRCTVEDGEPYNNKVSIEKLIKGKWEVVEEYPARQNRITSF